MVHEVAEHLNGLGKKEWWASTAVQGQQISQRADGKLQYSIQAIQGTVSRRACTSLTLEVLAEQEAWAADQPMPTAEEIQEAINKTTNPLSLIGPKRSTDRIQGI